MPKVNPNESRKSFVGRCIPIVIKEGATQAHAVAKCNGMYEQYLKRKRRNTRKKARKYPRKGSK